MINPLIYAEVSVGYQTIEELEELLPPGDYEREPLPYLAGFAAGKAFVRCRRGGGDKHSPMPDFYIGAHAAIAGYRLPAADPPRPPVPDLLPDHRDHRTALTPGRDSQVSSTASAIAPSRHAPSAS